LIKWERKYEIELETLRDQELDVMLEHLRMGKRHRIGRFAQVLQRLDDELEKRDLSQVKTEQLLRLNARYLELLRLELEPQELHVDVEGPLDGYLKIIEKCGMIVSDDGTRIRLSDTIVVPEK